MLQQFLGNRSDALHAHEHHFRAGIFCESFVVERALGFGRVFVSGEYGELRRVFAVSYGNSRIGRRGDCGADSRHDLEFQTGLHQFLGFLAAATEYKRIAAFEPHDALSFRRLLHEQRVGFILLQRMLIGALAGVDDFRARRCPFEDLGIAERVVHDHVCPRDFVAHFERHQSEVAGSRTREDANAFIVLCHASRMRISRGRCRMESPAAVLLSVPRVGAAAVDSPAAYPRAAPAVWNLRAWANR